ncbi:hypothetical protein KCV07_g357, partial [Aureobasidium melanogenum]
MDKSNETHKYFIDRLVEAFEILGGSQWATNQDTESNKAQTREEIEEVIFSNAFSALDIHQCADVSDDEADSGTLQATKHSQKSKKAKCNQRSKQKKNKRTRVANDPDILDVPLESYCLVDGPEGIHADYKMALVSVFVEWWKLRNHVQTMWFSVAYDDVNHAVAGVVSEMAITMIKKTALAVFVEFPAGFDTYQAMTRDFSRDELQDMFSSHPERFSEESYRQIDKTYAVKALTLGPESRPTTSYLGREGRMASVIHHQLALRSSQCLLVHRDPREQDIHQDEHATDDSSPLSTLVVWQLLKAEIWENVCSNQPLCGFNYLWLIAIILKTWTKIDDHLQKTQTPLFYVINQTPYNRVQYRRSQLIDQIRRGSSGNHRRCAEEIAKIIASLKLAKLLSIDLRVLKRDDLHLG